MDKRKNYFIDKKFQLDFITKFCLLVLAASILIMGIVYIMAKNATTVSFINSRVVVQSTSDFLLPVLIQTLIVSAIVVSIATIIFTMIISHRIAGPAFRFKKVLKSMAAGDVSGECKIRKNDSLQDVAASISDVMVNMCASLKGLDARIAALKEAVKKAPDQNTANELKKTISELEKSLHHFKF